MQTNSVEDRYCQKHKMWVRPFFAKNKKKYFCMHQYENAITGKSETCWVNTEEEDDGFREKQWDYAMDNMIGVEIGEDGKVLRD